MRRSPPSGRWPHVRWPVPRIARPSPLILLATAVAAAGALPAGPPRASAAPAPASSLRAAADTLRVLIYNIHAGKDADGEDNLERVAARIGEAGADLVLLQEVDRGTRRSGEVDQLAELERRTGLHGAFGKTLDYQGGGYGIAVLSRWPVARDTLIRLPVEPVQERAGGSYEPRGALRVRVEAPSGPLKVVNTHLDASADDTYRRQEVETVLRVAEELRTGGGTRVLLGGDFNDEPDSATIGRLTGSGWVDAWRACGDGEGRTYPAGAPEKRIDYLFLSPGTDCARAEVLFTGASDHRPLLVSLTREARGR